MAGCDILSLPTFDPAKKGMDLSRCNALVACLWIMAAMPGPLTVVRAQRTAGNLDDQNAELVVQTGHTSEIRSIEFSPDGKLLATGGNDHTVKLWEVESGRELKTFAGHLEQVSSISFSPDGVTIGSTGYDGTVKLWDITTGKLLATTPLPEDKGDAMDSVVFSPDGTLVATSQLHGIDGLITVREVPSLREVVSIRGHTFWAEIAFSPDGRMIASSERQEVVRLWNARTGVEIKTMTGKIHDQFKHNTADIVFSPDGRTLATAGHDGLARLWDVGAGEELKVFRGHTNRVSSVAFTPDGRKLITSSWDKTLRIWSVESAAEVESQRRTNAVIAATSLSSDGRLLASTDAHRIRIWNLVEGGEPAVLSGAVFMSERIATSSDGALLAVADPEDKIALWNLRTNTRVTILAGREGELRSMAFSPDARILATGGGFADGAIRLWNTGDGSEIRSVPGHAHAVYSLAFSPDGKLLASGGYDEVARIWDVTTGKILKEFRDRSRDPLANEIRAIVFTADGRSLIRSAFGGFVQWNIETGAVEKNMIGMGDTPDVLAASTDGKLLAGRGFHEKRVRAWDIASGAMIHDLPNSFAARETIRRAVPGIAFDDEAATDKFVLSIHENRKVKIFDRSTHTEIASLVAFGDGGWAVVTPDGLFDASAEARRKMHYVVGLEAVTLDQMKDVYYVPGLLRKVFAGDALPKIGLFSAKDLFPLVEFTAPKDGDKTMPVRITNRGGGIGQVQVLVNGKEFVRDARPTNFDPRAKHVELNIGLKDAPFTSTGRNKIEIVARNAAGSLTSRGARGAADEFVAGKAAQKPDPNIYVIAGGISHYAGENLNLNFAAKDAADFSTAVELGAIKLLKGDKSKVHVRLLTSGGGAPAKFSAHDAKVYGATKADFKRAFADFRSAGPDDVFIVYLAGHGTSVSQGSTTAGNSYLYLTQEATTTDRSVLAIESARRAMTVSSDELKDMMKQNKALKQVLILDTCAAGAASGSFVAKRDVPADQIGALERLKDNTGFYILMGSAADAVSYEASQYGQGLLTYALLQGMKGARLRNDQFADVELLFGYAKDTVGQLARHIGGIQRPETITPDVSRSFDIGEFTAAERIQIKTVAQPVPLVLRPRLTNSKVRYDNLGLEKILRAELRRSSLVVSGAVPKLMFVESDEMPDAFIPSGDYVVDGEKVTISLILVRNEQPVGNEIVVSGTISEKEALIRQLIDRVTEAARRPSI